MPNFIWMCSLCRLPVVKNRHFGQILTFLGAPVPNPFYRWGPNLVLEQTQGLHLQAKFHLNVFIVLASGGQKKHNFGQFLIFGGLLYWPPITNDCGDEGQIWCARADLQAKFHLNVFIASAFGGQKLVLLRYPKPTPKPRFFAKTIHRRNLGFFRHNWRFLGSSAC